MVQDLEKEYRGYDLNKVKRHQKTKQIVTLISVASFGGSTIFGLFNMYNKSLNSTRTAIPEKTEQQSPTAKLAAMEKGYLKVLNREANNVTALEGLVRVKLEQGDPKGAIAYLEKLVQLYPDNPGYKGLLGQLKQANQPNQTNQPVNQPK